MKKIRTLAGSCFAVIFAACLAAAANAAEMSELSVDQQLEMVRSLNEASRQATMAANVKLSQDKADRFWPVYRDYRAEVSRLNDQLKSVIVRYAQDYADIAGEEAYGLSAEALNLQIKRDRLKQKFLKRFSKASSALDAARVMQIENKLDALAQMELAIEIPLVGAPR